MTLRNSKTKLHDLLKDAYEQNNDLNNLMNSFSEENQELLEKQEQLQDLLDQVLTQELKDLLEEFYKLAEEFDENKLNKLSEQLDMSFEDLSKQLDRNLEMLKKMKIEQELKTVIEGISKLGVEEEKLADEILNTKDYQEVIEKDKSQKEKLKELKNSLGETLEYNKELEKTCQF